MTKPTFIGIGVQKGGTSWLHKQLLNHPEVFVPPHRKEIHFFDEYYDRDISWYEKFFNDATTDHKAIGEITPNYIYDNTVAPKIKNHYPDMRFIVILRQPVARAYSHYQMTFQSGEGQKYKDFNDFMTRHPHAFKRGLYAEQLTRWLNFFNPDQFLILTSEEIFKLENGVEKTFQKIGNFLKINPDLFDHDLAKEKVGEARLAPSSPTLARLAQNVRLFLRDKNLDFIAGGFSKIGITRQLIGNKNIAIPPLTDLDKKKWLAAYQDDIDQLKDLLSK